MPGISLVGSNAFVARALDQRVDAVVTIEPIGDGARWLRSLRQSTGKGSSSRNA